VVASTQALEFRATQDDESRYAWISQVLSRFGYRQLGRTDKGIVLAYLQRLGGYSRAQVTGLVARWAAAERVNDFAPLFVMNLLCKAVMISG